MKSIIQSSISLGKKPKADDIEIFNAELSMAMARFQITVEAEDLGWNWTGSGEETDRMLWPVVHDAVRLLTSSKRSRVRKCMDDRCGWLFLDTSRNRSRRWCSMKDCGNRAKARRHYRRIQK